MKYQGLRDWLSIIEHRGELTLGENVDWKLEMGAIVDVLYREHPPYAPALIFDRSRITNRLSNALWPFRLAAAHRADPWELKKNLTTFYNSRACTTRE